MNSSIDVLASLRGFVQLGGVTSEDIAAAENELCVVFAEEYSEYLATYGVVSCNGHELTGICQSPRLNVVEATKAERDADSQELHDKVLKLEFTTTALKDSQSLNATAIDDLRDQTSQLNINIVKLDMAVASLTEAIKGLKEGS